MKKADDPRAHWEAVYEKGDVERLGWYEESPEQSLEMIEQTGVPATARILDVGSGASTLIRSLLDRGFEKIVATDISSRALEKARERLAGRDAGRVTWMVDDVLRPERLLRLAGQVDVWHDRALFHFLIEDLDRGLYLQTLRSLVRPGGFVIIAAFSLVGVDRCSGLPVRRYDENMIGEALGTEFQLTHSFDWLYVTPGGEHRPYVYTLFSKRSE